MLIISNMNFIMKGNIHCPAQKMNIYSSSESSNQITTKMQMKNTIPLSLSKIDSVELRSSG